MDTEKTKELLSKAHTCQLEIDLCDKRIAFLQTMGNVLLNDPNITIVDMLLITRPKSGARPVTMPLFPLPNRDEMVDFYANDTPLPMNTKQIGFQRFFNPVELGNDEMLTVEIPIESNMMLGIIEQIITKIKQRKQVLLIDIEDIFKK